MKSNLTTCSGETRRIPVSAGIHLVSHGLLSAVFEIELEPLRAKTSLRDERIEINTGTFCQLKITENDKKRFQ